MNGVMMLRVLAAVESLSLVIDVEYNSHEPMEDDGDADDNVVIS
mgnify:CR=1 FL=1